MLNDRALDAALAAATTSRAIAFDQLMAHAMHRAEENAADANLLAESVDAILAIARRAGIDGDAAERVETFVSGLLGED